MAHKDQVKVKLENRVYTQVRSGVIIEDIVADVLRYRMPPSMRTVHTPLRTPTYALLSAKRLLPY